MTKKPVTATPRSRATILRHKREVRRLQIALSTARRKYLVSAGWKPTFSLALGQDLWGTTVAGNTVLLDLTNALTMQFKRDND